MSTVHRTTKKNLTGLTLGELQEFVRSLGEAPFRGKQLFDWLYTRDATSFDEMTSLSKSLRAKLPDAATVDSLRLMQTRRSDRDGTTKLLFGLHDGGNIESVLIPSDPADADEGARPGTTRKRARLTLCVSTQVGCPLDCAFCATGTMGYTRNLSTDEIIDQIRHARRLAGKRISNLVYMGMGEPLMNYDNVMKSIEIVTAGLHIAPRRITVSTAGWTPRIRQLADERRRVKLALSLHSLDERHRSTLMPINRKFGLEGLIGAMEYYYKKTKQRITYEYILFEGFNDTEDDIRRLIKLSRRIPSKINIVPFHSIEFTHPRGFAASLRPTPTPRADRFIQRLREANITVIVRSNAGEDIEAACGQLAVIAGSKSRKTLPALPVPDVEFA